MLFAILVVSVISSPSSTTAEFTLIRPVRPSMMLSELKSRTVLFAEASCCCRVVMEAWRAWSPLACLLSSAGSSGLAEASDASVTRARDVFEPSMVNYFKIVLLLGVSLSFFYGWANVGYLPSTADWLYCDRDEIKFWRGESGQRMTNAWNAYHGTRCTLSTARQSLYVDPHTLGVSNSPWEGVRPR